MTKYRIITNGYKYRIQEKFWLFWRTVHELIGHDFSSPIEFASKREAQEAIARWLDYEKKTEPKWRTVK